MTKSENPLNIPFDLSKKANLSYDQEADVLYISLGEPVPATSIDCGNNLIIRYDENTKMIVGFTITNLCSLLKLELDT